MQTPIVSFQSNEIIKRAFILSIKAYFERKLQIFYSLWETKHTPSNIPLTNSNPWIEHKINIYNSFQNCAGKQVR